MMSRLIWYFFLKYLLSINLIWSVSGISLPNLVFRCDGAQTVDLFKYNYHETKSA